ncbi:PRD domain-containing protein [Paenibacillus sp. LMG 31459]|uniref:Ascorbate-specific PTS system EIIA component n=1 Tax=Paenibacillus phytohabitans TaxID=2654978 RepID=A0ABX1YR01_9BACL|nr:BglG family transcription antiterminator [Paenibacillus phytohabitans]NOU83328.1 PRD domain-containing protein [Paenibacillus phytohabitans]
MELDARSSSLLQELLTNSGIRNKDLELKYGLSRRQIEYSFGKINDWLEARYLPQIKRTKTGHFLIHKALLTALSSEQNQQAGSTYVLSEEERTNLIILMLLSKNSDLSLLHFTDALGVSKNTILSDLKNAQAIAGAFDLAVTYSRVLGYSLEGKEFNKRQALINIVYRTIDMYGGETWIKELSGADSSEIAALSRKMEAVEAKLNLKFTDEKMESMPYILLLSLRRIRQGQIVEGFHIHCDELSDTKEYQAVEEILHDLQGIPTEERLFFTLHLLTTNVSSMAYLSEDTLPELTRALDEMLSLFERSACVTLQDRGQLLDKILLHLKPAYYRIKYQLTIANPLQETIGKEFKELHHLVKQSSTPLRRLIGVDIPESETTYLTMLIGGWLSRQGDSLQQKIKALVVCPKGVCVSRLLQSTLRELFREFIFFDSLSVREFHSYALEYDVVFSTVYLPTDKKLFVIKSYLDKEDKHRLRQQVMQEMSGYSPSEFNMELIMEIVGKHAVIANSHSLREELEEHFQPGDRASGKRDYDTRMPDLSGLLTPDTIRLERRADSWQEAIRLGAEPLLRRGAITPGYVEAMIDSYDREDPYIVISPGLAIPHADPASGVNEVSMSLLRLEEPVSYSDDCPVQVIIIIAAKDKHQHLRSLMQLMQLAGSQEAVRAVIEAGSAQEIHKVVVKFSKD